MVFCTLITSYLINLILRIQYNPILGLSPLNNPSLTVIFVQLRDGLVDIQPFLKTLKAISFLLPTDVLELLDYYINIPWKDLEINREEYEIQEGVYPISPELFMFVIIDLLRAVCYEFDDDESQIILSVCERLLGVSLEEFKFEQLIIVYGKVKNNDTRNANKFSTLFASIFEMTCIIMCGEKTVTTYYPTTDCVSRRYKRIRNEFFQLQ